MNLVASIHDMQQTLLEAGDGLVIVKFGAEWCVPCNRIKSEYQKTLKRFYSVKAREADYDTSQELFDHYGVAAMPTFAIFKSGELVEMLPKPSTETIAEALIFADPLQNYHNPPKLVLDADF